MNRRWLFAAVTAVCAVLLGFGYYLQYREGLEPCPLCMVQRVAFMAAGAIALVAALHGAARTGTRIYAALLLLFAGFGAGIAGRQIWLQHLPADKVPECGPGLDFMLEVYPMRELIVTLLSGRANARRSCGDFSGCRYPSGRSCGS